MTSTSKSYRPKRRNWLDIPSDILADILSRVGAIDILENAQLVCTAWRKICKNNPDVWRVIYMENYWDPKARPLLRQMCEEAVNRSQFGLVDIAIVDFCNDDLLFYVAYRSSQLRSLDISGSSDYLTDISVETIRSVGRHCPMLETLKMNKERVVFSDRETTEDYYELKNKINTDTAIAIAIGKNFCQLKHLELIGNYMTNVGLRAILDGCPHIELLDLRQCYYIDLKTDLGERCSQQITYLKLSNDFVDSTACNVTAGYKKDYDDDDYYYSEDNDGYYNEDNDGYKKDYYYDDDDYYSEDNDGYYNEDNEPLYSDSEEFVDYDNVADNDDNDDDDDDFSKF
ncbi:RNI-like superfamily protein [Artemisia annua]|uniref:RNI-like superfamily protein n=1 Tax=Artemisia annua TaxID=35608 RepID=A0A2U1QE62_ARTAN|nr:RNI-like superfamily protein [Artemisia annua]